MKIKLFIVVMLLAFISCTQKADFKTEVQNFLEDYNKNYQRLWTASQNVEWRVNTHIVEGDSTNEIAVRRANEEMAKYTGSTEIINKTKGYLEKQSELEPLQVLQLKRILYLAASNPQTVEEKVKDLIKAKTQQTEKLFGFNFKIDTAKVSTNDIDEILNKETDLLKRQKAWEASKEVGKALKEGLTNLQRLRNETVQALDYKDFFTYQVSDYGMSTEEMMTLLKKINNEIYPLYRELHTYARYELAKKYGVQDVPDMIPAHWLTNRWGQDWSSMVAVEGVNLDSGLRSKSNEWLVKQAEEFYKSIGFDALPASFYEKSDLYPLPENAKHSKNNHASAWHMDLDNDLRSLMSVIPNTEWYETTHHELGHIYYFTCYSNPDVPVILREGANRAYHEAVGTMIGLAAMQKPFIMNLNLIPKDTASGYDIKSLLKEALNYIVFIPWSAGVMSEFEHDLYSQNLPADQYNKRWWELVKKYQGIVPLSDRGEEYCDAASKTHINDDAAQYYDYALSFILLFQLHDHIAENILKQDPHATNYFGNKEVGKFLKEIMTPGMSRDWRELLIEKTGEDLSARAMLDYFSPLMDYLKKENAGRKYTLVEEVR